MILAALTLLTTVVLYKRGQDTSNSISSVTRVNCATNHSQDVALAGLLTAALDVGVQDPALRRAFNAFIERVRNAPTCPPLH